MVSTSDLKTKKRKAAPAAVTEDGDQMVNEVAAKPEESVEVEVKKQEETDDKEAEEEEVEVISHAEQRKRRKLEKQRARSGQTGDDGEAGEGAEASNSKSEESKAAAAAAEPPRQPKSIYGIWVGNLSFKTDADQLREFFSLCGNITRINLPKGTKFQPNKGFAYIDFDSREALAEAIALSESNLDGRRLLIKDATDYKGRPKNENVDAAAKALLGIEGQEAAADGKDAPSAEKSLTKTARKILERQKNPPAPTLFIGNLAFDATVESIREAFEARALARKKWESKKGMKKGDRKGKGKAESDSEEEESDSEADSAEEGSDSDDDKEGKESKRPSIVVPNAAQGGPAGIRKIRIGTFEDSGKCKGWAFIDFHNVAQATQSLIDGRNHYMNGRTLTVEFASADAVRRGGGKMEGAFAGSEDKKGGRAPFGGKSSSFQNGKRQRDSYTNGGGGGEDGAEYEGKPARQEVDHEAPKQAFYRPPLPLPDWRDETAKTHKPNKEERQALREDKKGKGKRQKPGAALANAQRAKTAIQPSAGKKITFE